MEKLKLEKFQKFEIKKGNLIRGGAAKGDHEYAEGPTGTCGGGCLDVVTEKCDDPSTGDTLDLGEVSSC